MLKEAISEAEYALELGYEPARDLLKRLWELPHSGRRQDALRTESKPPRPRTGEPSSGAEDNRAREHYTRGVTFRKQEQWIDAASELQAAVQISPHFVNAHVELGKVYARQKHWDGAIHEFQTVLSIDPEYANAHFYLGLVHAEHARWADAAREFEQTLRIAPSHVEARKGLSVARRQLRGPSR